MLQSVDPDTAEGALRTLAPSLHVTNKTVPLAAAGGSTVQGEGWIRDPSGRDPSGDEALHRSARQERRPGAEAAIARRAFRQVWIGAAAWAVVFGDTVAASALTYVSSLPDPASRQQLAATTSGDAGLATLLGPVSSVGTVGGYTVYKCFVFL